MDSQYNDKKHTNANETYKKEEYKVDIKRYRKCQLMFIDVLLPSTEIS
jgi:hypothetical protein